MQSFSFATYFLEAKQKPKKVMFLSWFSFLTIYSSQILGCFLQSIQLPSTLCLTLQIIIRIKNIEAMKSKRERKHLVMEKVRSGNWSNGRIAQKAIIFGFQVTNQAKRKIFFFFWSCKILSKKRKRYLPDIRLVKSLPQAQNLIIRRRLVFVTVT